MLSTIFFEHSPPEAGGLMTYAARILRDHLSYNIEKNYQSSPFVIHYCCEGNSLLSLPACAIDEKNLLTGTGATIFGLHPRIFASVFSNKLLQTGSK